MMFYETKATSSDVLAEWRWLIGGRPIQVGWSSSGDLFFSDPSGRVCRIDTGSGEIGVVAGSLRDFLEAIKDPTQAEDVLLLPVVQSYEEKHGKLEEGQCLGFVQSPVFGGAYTAENRQAMSVAEHAASSGEIFRQIRDLPDGTKVRLKVDL
jgi:hypothetical protein